MKKIAIVVVAVIALSLAFASVASAGGNGAVKENIFMMEDSQASGAVVGFAVFNSDGNGGINAQVVIKDLDPDTVYIVVLQASIPNPREDEGEVTTNAQGQATIHLQADDITDYSKCRVIIRTGDNSAKVASNANNGEGIEIPEKPVPGQQP